MGKLAARVTTPHNKAADRNVRATCFEFGVPIWEIFEPKRLGTSRLRKFVKRVFWAFSF